MENLKASVRDFWNQASCGEDLYMHGRDRLEQFNNQLRERYTLEPFIAPFADFPNTRGLKVLEIGVGLGADHQMFAQNGAVLSGCDLTERAIENTRQRLELFGLSSDLRVADAENLPYANDSFDLVYSWGVIHHSPDTPGAVKEIYRILRPGGKARVMIYHKHSFVGYMLWLRYAFLAMRPFTPLRKIYSAYLESPGTKAYTVDEARRLFSDFRSVTIETVLTHGDMLSSHAGQRHKGIILRIARKIWPRFFIQKFFPQHGLFMLIQAEK